MSFVSEKWKKRRKNCLKATTLLFSSRVFKFTHKIDLNLLLNMDKKSKEAMRRYKKSRQQQAHSSASSSSSETDSNSSSSYSSSDSERKVRKKLRQTAGSTRRSSSTSLERRKREAKKLEAKRNHIKRKLKEAKLKKRAAAAAAALSGQPHRLSPATQSKLKKLAERKHQREKHRSAAREHEREKHRSPNNSNKVTKIRIHQDVQRQKSPARMHHFMAREKIIIQTRTRSHTPTHEKMRHEMLRERERRDRDHREREIARDKERSEALARCQERQRERERLAREKLRRDEEEKFGRLSERDLALAAHARVPFGSRERSMDPLERARHLSYDREREFLDAAERRGLLDREELRRHELSPVHDHYAGRLRDPRDLFLDEERERVYGRYYDEHERAAWLEARELREREIRDYRDFDRELFYPAERERLLRERERLALRGDWKPEWDLHRERDWHDAPARGGFVGGPKRGGLHGKSTATATAPRSTTRERESQQQQQQQQQQPPQREQTQQREATAVAAREPTQRAPSEEPDWDAEELQEAEAAKKVNENTNKANTTREPWVEHDNREKPGTPNTNQNERRWQTTDWRDNVGETATASPLRGHRNERGGRGYRRGSAHIADNYRTPSMMQLSSGGGGGSNYGNAGGNNSPRFQNKRMTYTNPNIIRNKNVTNTLKTAAQASAVAAATTAVAAAKAAAQSAATSNTTPGILAQVSGVRCMTANDKPEAGEIVGDADSAKTETETIGLEAVAAAAAAAAVVAVRLDEKTADLSEISDSEDDILSKGTAAKKPKLDDDEAICTNELNEATDSAKLETAVKLELAQDETTAAMPTTTNTSTLLHKTEDEELMDFEEISDGELEEEARHKGVGDALGVDWASLIAETKRQTTPTTATEQMTTAKQRWQPHRLILNMGISMRMAGESYAKQLLTQAQQQLIEELLEKDIVPLKTEIKEETISVADENSQSTQLQDNDENKNNEIAAAKVELLEEPKCENKWPLLEKVNSGAMNVLNVEQLHPYACIQVAEHKRQLEHSKLFNNICGADSRALSARQDLQLRRQLCNLPARACDFPRPLPAVSNKLKALVLARFQRTLEVK